MFTRSRAATGSILVVFLISLPCHAVSEPEVDSAANTVRSSEICGFYGEELFKSLGMVLPGQVVRGTPKKTGAAAVAALQKQYGLGSAAAKHLLLAQASLCSLHGPDQEAATQLKEAALAHLVEATRAAPGNLAALAAMASASASLDSEPLGSRLMDAVSSAPAPEKAALRLASSPKLDRWRERLLSMVLERKPELLGDALVAYGCSYPRESEAVFLLGALDKAFAEPKRPKGFILAARCAIDGLLSFDASMLALRTFERLTTAEREAALHLKAKDLSASTPDALAAEYLVRGDLESAAKLYEKREVLQRPSHRLPSYELEELQEKRLRQALLGHFLGRQPPPDLFDLAVAAHSFSPSFGLLAARLLSPRYAARVRQNFALLERVLLNRRGLPSAEHAPALAAGLALVVAGLDAEKARIEEAKASLPPPPTLKDPMASRIAAALSGQHASPFHEVPFPEGVKPGAPAPDGTRPSLRLPRGFRFIRLQQADTQVTVLAQSQHVDPSGEVGFGAYWLLTSPDNGKTWDELLYLDLRQNRPYVAVEQSSVPLVEGGRLRIEVQAKAVVESTITFPPVCTQFEPPRPAILEASLADLRRDSDGDGLTDVLESRLLTDPTAADSDGDGAPDGLDPTPLLPTSKTREDAEAKALEALFAEFDVGCQHRRAHRVPTPGERSPRLVGLYPVTFVVGDRSRFSGVPMAGTVIVLSPEEVEHVEARTGTFLPLEVPPPVIDEAGQRLYLEWSEQWQSGTYTGSRGADGSWLLTEGPHIVT